MSLVTCLFLGGGSLGLDLLMIIQSIETASLHYRELLPHWLSSQPVFHMGLVMPGFEPMAFPLGDASPTDISVFAARP